MDEIRFSFEEGLLTKFINERLQKFEPQKTFSKRKYHASLLRLTNSTLKEIAKQSGASLTSTLRWNTEQDFLEQVKKNHEEFIDTFLQIVDLFEILNQQFKAYYLQGKDDEAIAYLRKIETPSLSLQLRGLNIDKVKGKKIIFSLDIRSDAKLYSDLLLVSIGEASESPKFKVASTNLRIAVLAILQEFVLLREKKKFKNIEEQKWSRFVLKQIFKKEAESADKNLEKVESLLDKEGVSIQTKRRIINHINGKNNLLRYISDVLEKILDGK